MANSLIDFGQVAQTAIALGQLAETQRRNDIYQQNSLQDLQRIEVQREQNRIEQARLKQSTAFRAFDELEKLKNHPTNVQNPLAQVDLTYAQGRLLETGLGINVPLPSREEMVGGYESIKSLVKTLKDGTPEEKREAAAQAMIANPTWGRQILDDMKKAGEVSTQIQELDLKIQANQAKLESLNKRNASLGMQQNLYTEHLSAMKRVSDLTADPKYQQHLRKLHSLPDAKARQAYLAVHPIFKEQFESDLSREGVPLPGIVFQLREERDIRKQALIESQERTGQIPAELEEELSGYEVVRRARELEQEFIQDPYNPETWKAFRKAQQDLRILHTTAGKKVSEIADARLQLAQTKFDVQQDAQKNLAAAQVEFGKLPPGQQTAQKAAEIAGKYQNVLPEDVRKAVKDPNTPLVSIQQKQESAESVEVGKSFGKQFTDIQNDAIDAQGKLARLDRMEQLLQGVQTGRLTPTITQIAALADSLGVSLDKTLPAKQALEALSNEVALTLRNPSGGAGMPGALSDKDREFLVSMTPGLAKTPEGNQLIIDTARKLAKRSQEVAKMARAYRKQHGHFDEGFLDELQEFADKNPLFGRAEREMVGPKAMQAPALSETNTTLPRVQSDEDFDRLPSGTIFIDPDGAYRRKP